MSQENLNFQVDYNKQSIVQALSQYAHLVCETLPLVQINDTGLFYKTNIGLCPMPTNNHGDYVQNGQHSLYIGFEVPAIFSQIDSEHYANFQRGIGKIALNHIGSKVGLDTVEYRGNTVYIPVDSIISNPKSLNLHRRDFLKKAASVLIGGKGTYDLCKPDSSSSDKIIGAGEIIVALGLVAHKPLSQALVHAAVNKYRALSGDQSPERWNAFENSLAAQIGTQVVSKGPSPGK